MPPENPATAGAWRDARRGDLVEIDGRTIRGGFAPNVQPSRVTRLGTAALPAPKRIPYTSMLTGRHDCDYVEILGVVQRAWLSSDQQVRTMFADVAFEEGVVRAAFWDHTPADLTRLIDARVRLRGNIGTIFGNTEQLRGVSLFVGRTSDVEVLESPPDPFALPMRSIRSMYKYSPAGEVNRRIRVRGVVTGYIPGKPIELQDFTSTAKFRFVRHVLVRPRRDRRGAHRDGAAAAHTARNRGRSRRVPGRLPGKTHPHERAVQSGRPGIPARAGDRGRIERHHARERRDARAHAGPAAQPPHEPHAARARRQGRRHRVRRRARARHRHDRGDAGAHPSRAASSP